MPDEGVHCFAISRRAFGGAVTGGLIRAAFGAGHIPVALQLYSVRRQCEANFRPTLARVKQIGFDGVEFAGYYHHTPSELRRILDDNGLTCCGAHVPVDDLLGARFSPTVDFHHQLGTRRLIVPSLPSSQSQSSDAWIDGARLLGDLSAELASTGLFLGYEPHAPGGLHRAREQRRRRPCRYRRFVPKFSAPSIGFLVADGPGVLHTCF